MTVRRMFEDYLNIELPDRGEGSLLDSIEFRVLVSQAPISKADVENISEGAEDVTSWADSVFAKLSARARAYGPRTPYKVVRNSIVSTLSGPDERPEYLAMLLFSLFGNGNQGGEVSSDEGGRLFEKICLAALRGVWRRWHVLQTGSKAQRKPAETIARLLQDRLHGPLPQTAKDLGLDIFAYRPWYDRHPGRPAYFVQCAAGANWVKKDRELSVAQWREYIDFTVNPIPGLCIPYCLDAIEGSREKVRRVDGLLLDRPRIYSGSGALSESKRKTILEWCEKKLKAHSG